jgi:hypothetical protein
MKLDRSRIWSLEDYAARRPAFRTEVIAHKKVRRIALANEDLPRSSDEKTAAAHFESIRASLVGDLH